jgi:hypothetical protein
MSCWTYEAAVWLTQPPAAAMLGTQSSLPAARAAWVMWMVSWAERASGLAATARPATSSAHW